MTRTHLCCFSLFFLVAQGRAEIWLSFAWAETWKWLYVSTCILSWSERISEDKTVVPFHLRECSQPTPMSDFQALDLRKMPLAAPPRLPKLRSQQGVQKYLHDGHAQSWTAVNCSQLSRRTSFPSDMLRELHQVTWPWHTGTLNEVKKIILWHLDERNFFLKEKKIFWKQLSA